MLFCRAFATPRRVDACSRQQMLLHCCSTTRSGSAGTQRSLTRKVARNDGQDMRISREKSAKLGDHPTIPAHRRRGGDPVHRSEGLYPQATNDTADAGGRTPALLEGRGWPLAPGRRREPNSSGVGERPRALRDGSKLRRDIPSGLRGIRGYGRDRRCVPSRLRSKRRPSPRRQRPGLMFSGSRSARGGGQPRTPQRPRTGLAETSRGRAGRFRSDLR